MATLTTAAPPAGLDVLDSERLGDRALVMGEELRRRLRESLPGYEMVQDVRGLGMLSGIEFQTPGTLKLRVPFEAFRGIHSGMFGRIVGMRIFHDWRILTRICGNNFMVLKVAPPLVVTRGQLDRFVDAFSLARRAVNV